MISRQLQDSYIPFLITVSGSAQTGLTEADLKVEIAKPVESALFADKTTFTADEFQELGGGYYHIKMIGAEDLNVLGQNLIRVGASLTGPAVDEQVVTVNVVPQNISEIAPPNTCKIFGDLTNAAGESSGQQEVSLFIKEHPHITGGYVATNETVYNRTDALGHFEIYAPRLSVVVISIPNSGIRKQFTVPDQDTFSLVDILAL